LTNCVAKVTGVPGEIEPRNRRWEKMRHPAQFKKSP
jgi:hypothetical protein